MAFDPPGETRRGNDWVLVLDNAVGKFPPPENRSGYSWKARMLGLPGDDSRMISRYFPLYQTF